MRTTSRRLGLRDEAAPAPSQRRIMSSDLQHYHVPVDADVHEIETNAWRAREPIRT